MPGAEFAKVERGDEAWCQVGESVIPARRRFMMERERTAAEARSEEFFPSGAIAFFFFMIAFYAVLWLVLYWVMAARA